ncbi:MAG: AEC family transporter [Verrucomicrobiota bacterium]
MTRIVLVKIAGMFLVILLGWLARRRGFLAAELTGVISRLVVEVAFPALVFTQMLRTVDLPALKQGWASPLLCGGIIGLAWMAGCLLAPFFCPGSQRRTFVFLVAIPNWVFLPLPIAEALYGEDGVRTVLLANAGAQLVLWSFGVWILHGALRQSGGQLLRNTGLWATALGIAAALLIPASRQLESGASLPAAAWPAVALVQALAVIGSLTIPLSLLAIGAQLGELNLHLHRLSRPLWGVLLGRLVVAPLGLILLVVLAAKLGFPLPEQLRMITYLIGAMPVAISCSVMAERFGGDAALSAQGIFYSTLFSLGTVPLLFWLVQRLGW